MTSAGFSKRGSTVTGKNLLVEEPILSFKSCPLLDREAKTKTELLSLQVYSNYLEENLKIYSLPFYKVDSIKSHYYETTSLSKHWSLPVQNGIFLMIFNKTTSLIRQL